MSDFPWANQTCFIIGPIGNKLDPRGTPGRTRYEEGLQMWEKVFEPACEELGLQPVRADKLAEPGEIPEQIFEFLRDSPVVIADVTAGNPNVMYELGSRHTRDLVTVQVGQYERLPFDISSIRTIQFHRTEGGLIEVRDQLIDTLRAGLEGKGKPVTVTRVWSELSGINPAALQAAVDASKEPDDDSIPSEPGFMDVLAEGEIALSELAGTMEEITESIVAIGDLSTQSTEAVNESDARGGGFAGRLTVAKMHGEALSGPAADLEEDATEFNLKVDKIDAMVQYILLRASTEDADSEEVAALQEFLKNALTMVAAVEESADPGTRAMLKLCIDLRKISRLLAPVSKVLERALNQLLRGFGVIAGWRQPIEDVLSGGS